MRLEPNVYSRAHMEERLSGGMSRTGFDGHRVWWVVHTGFVPFRRANRVLTVRGRIISGAPLTDQLRSRNWRSRRHLRATEPGLSSRS
jgi:hypothetical protein